MKKMRIATGTGRFEPMSPSMLRHAIIDRKMFPRPNRAASTRSMIDSFSTLSRTWSHRPCNAMANTTPITTKNASRARSR